MHNIVICQTTNKTITMSTDQKVQITRTDYVGKVESSDHIYDCGCTSKAYIRMSYKYCPFCGKAVDWKAVAFGK